MTMEYNTIRRNSLLGFFLFFCLSCFGQQYTKGDFVPVKIPMIGDSQWTVLDTIRGNYVAVNLVSGKLALSKYVFSNGVPMSLLQGRLLAFNIAELGCALLYKPNDEKLKYITVNGQNDTARNIEGMGRLTFKNDPVIKLLQGEQFPISRNHVISIFKYRDSIYLLEGIDEEKKYSKDSPSITTIPAHGLISKISINDDFISINKVAEVNDYPSALTVRGDSILLATHGRFYLIRNWKQEVVFDNLFWQGLYPNSIAINDDRHVYVGMKGAYAQINLKDRVLNLFKLRSL